MFELLSPKATCERLAERAKALRLARNITQEELAQRAGCSLSSVRRFEAGGQGTLDLVVRIAQALHAAQGLEPLFEQPVGSIAQAEAQVRLQARQRARAPAARK